MSGKFNNGKWNLGAKYDVQVKAGEGTTVAEVFARTTANDTLYITSGADIIIPAGPLKLHGYFDGNYIGSLLNNTQSVDLKVRIGTEFENATFQYIREYNGEPAFDAPQLHRFELDLPVNNNGSTSLNLYITTNGKFKTESGILGFTMGLGKTFVTLQPSAAVFGVGSVGSCLWSR